MWPHIPWELTAALPGRIGRWTWLCTQEKPLRSLENVSLCFHSFPKYKLSLLFLSPRTRVGFSAGSPCLQRASSMSILSPQLSKKFSGRDHFPGLLTKCDSGQFGVYPPGSETWGLAVGEAQRWLPLVPDSPQHCPVWLGWVERNGRFLISHQPPGTLIPGLPLPLAQASCRLGCCPSVEPGSHMSVLSHVRIMPVKLVIS